MKNSFLQQFYKKFSSGSGQLPAITHVIFELKKNHSHIPPLFKTALITPWGFLEFILKKRFPVKNNKPPKNNSYFRNAAKTFSKIFQISCKNLLKTLSKTFQNTKTFQKRSQKRVLIPNSPIMQKKVLTAADIKIY